MRTPASRQSPQQGYVLVLTLFALAMMAFVAARLAYRIDALREQASSLRNYSQAMATAQDARAMAFYWLATRPAGYSGVGFLDEVPAVADGRWYRLPSSAMLSLQDERGLLSANSPDRSALGQVLRDHGLGVDQAEQWMDVLEDYTDTDNSKRLNGAEADDYARLGLPPPRNDWLLSVRELCAMPGWRDVPATCAQLTRLLSTRRDGLFNPNTAPLALVHAKLPTASAELLEKFDALRQAEPMPNGQTASANTGLPMVRDDFLFHVSNGFRLTLWAEGMPTALEYNLRIFPTLPSGPWLVQEVTSAARPGAADAQLRVANFPVPSTDVSRTAAPAASAP